MTRSFVAVRRVHFPGGVSTWSLLSPRRASAGEAAGDARSVEAALGRSLGFAVAVFDGPDVVQLLDSDGDPLDVAPEDLREIRDDLMEESRHG